MQNEPNKTPTFFYVLDRQTGKPIGTEKADAVAEACGLVPNRNVFAVTEDGRLVILDTQGEYSIVKDPDIMVSFNLDMLG